MADKELGDYEDSPFAASFQDTGFREFVDQSFRQNGSSSSKFNRTHDNSMEVETPISGISDENEILENFDDFELDSQTMKQLDEVEEAFLSTQQTQTNPAISAGTGALNVFMGNPKHDASREASFSNKLDSRSRSCNVTECTKSMYNSKTQVVANATYSGNNLTTLDEKGLGSISSQAEPEKRQVRSVDRVVNSSSQANARPGSWRHLEFNTKKYHVVPTPVTPQQFKPSKQNHDRKHHTSNAGGNRHNPPLPSSSAAVAAIHRPNATHRFQGSPDEPYFHQHSLSESSYEAQQLRLELQKLRSENKALIASANEIKSQLYTRAGEVETIRRQLTKTETDNVQLQEKLSEHITTALKDKAAIEQSLNAEIESLKSQLKFKENETHSLMHSRATKRAGSSPGTTSLSSITTGHSRTKEPKSLSRSGAKNFPTMSDFSFVPQANTVSVGVMTDAQLMDQDSRVDRDMVQNRATDGHNLHDPQHKALMAMLDEMHSTIAVEVSSKYLTFEEKLIGFIAKGCQPELVKEFHLLFYTKSKHFIHRLDVGSLWMLWNVVLNTLLRVPRFFDVWLKTSCEVRESRAADVCSVAHECIYTLVDCLKKKGALPKHPSKDGSEDSSGLYKWKRAIEAACELNLTLMSTISHQGFQSAVTERIGVHSLYRLVTIPTELHAILSPVLTYFSGLLQLVPFWQAMVTMNPESKKLDQLIEQIMSSISSLCREPRELTKAYSKLEAEYELLKMIASILIAHPNSLDTLVKGCPSLLPGLLDLLTSEYNMIYSTARPWPLRIRVVTECVKCLHILFAEIDDTLTLFGGDRTPQYYAFTATCCRLSFGVAGFEDCDRLRELASNMLASIVTKKQYEEMGGDQDIFSPQTSGNLENM